MKSTLHTLATLSALLFIAAAPARAENTTSDFRAWIIEMKAARRGPFSQIRWFCKDGSLLPPTPYGCKDHGGGEQHGDWSERTLILRGQGYRIASFLAGLDAAAFVEHEARTDAFMQMLIEQFLIRADDGWILRKARYYRGAYQEEGERKGARRLLFKLAEDPQWLGFRYLPLRIAARLLAHGRETTLIQDVRQLSAALSDRDPAFKTVRNKIHVSPSAGDARAVRDYLAGVADPGLRDDLERLARAIEAAYTQNLPETIEALEKRAGGDLASVIRQARAALAGSPPAHTRFRVTAALLAALRDRLSVPNAPDVRIEIIDAGLAVESEHFTAAATLAGQPAPTSRRERLELLGDSIEALYGTGLVSNRQRRAMHEQLRRLATTEVSVATYKEVLDYLALAPTWGTQNLRQFFAAAMATLETIEPKAGLFIQDQLRGSPLFFYAKLIDTLVRDANRLAGVDNQLFGANVGAGLRSLNPGIARGRLRLGLNGGDVDPEGIYLLPETVADLPPVAGILTAGEGNPLSHVQLLARNLGIPNVSVDQDLVEPLRAHDGERVILAVSPAGSVRLFADHGEWAAIAGEAAGNPGSSMDRAPVIRVNLEKLDLETREFLPLGALRERDSGRIVGPKAAKLGELKHHYPEAVADGLAIPFGVFRDLLAQPMPGEGKTVFEWMQAEYRGLEDRPENDGARREATAQMRARLEDWVLNAVPATGFRETLRERLTAMFGTDGTFGVFVRSDTNVEDLAGFTGAGLNLTVPNVVGFEHILAAISRVWASPFSERSFAWRQSMMDQPEHVYPAVLLMHSVDVDKSGVLVTCDIDSGSPEWLSIAVNEGVGGAVDGQSAESLRVNTRTGEVRLLAQATAPYRRKLDGAGGVAKLPVSGTDAVLQPAEIAQLIALARELPQRFPPIVDAAGQAAPADIEFGFLDGRLRLFQIRPFLDNPGARGSDYLRSLDTGREQRAVERVVLDAPL